MRGGSDGRDQTDGLWRRGCASLVSRSSCGSLWKGIDSVRRSPPMRSDSAGRWLEGLFLGANLGKKCRAVVSERRTGRG